jgi:3-dehydroshikimate dehydratase
MSTSTSPPSNDTSSGPRAEDHYDVHRPLDSEVDGHRVPTAGISTGVCSVSFRALTPQTVIDLAHTNDLDGIEWGSDIHVPVGDLDQAATVADATEHAGLRVLSYGSYWSAEDDTFPAVLRTARALRAPRIRVWAGRLSSSETSAAQRSHLTRQLRDAADLAAAQGIELGLEFHGGTLTDTLPSTERLLQDIDHPNVHTYWQPALNVEDAEALTGLKHLMRAVSTIHVFSWWPDAERRPLAERSELWASVIDQVLASGTTHDLLLEFVADNEPDQLAADASTLHALIAAAHTGEGARR